MAKFITSQPLYRKCCGSAENKQIGFPASLMFFTAETFPNSKWGLIRVGIDWFDQTQKEAVSTQDLRTSWLDQRA